MLTRLGSDIMNESNRIEEARVSTARVVLLTLGAVMIVALLVGGGIGGYLLYDRQRDKNTRLGTDVERLEEELAAANDRADRAFSKGMTAGQEIASEGFSERDYNRGRNDAFAGFGTWTTDAWYVVFVVPGEGKVKYQITYRVTMEPCTAYILKGDAVATRAEPQPC